MFPYRLFLVKRTLYNEINLFRHVRNTFMLLKHLKQIVTHFFRNPYFIVIIHNRSIKMNTNVFIRTLQGIGYRNNRHLAGVVPNL